MNGQLDDWVNGQLRRLDDCMNGGLDNLTTGGLEV